MTETTEITHPHVALGGTFDNLHIGHHALLETAFVTGKRVTIGLTSDEFVKSKTLALAINPYPTRLKNLKAYLKSKKWTNLSEIKKINDKIGTTLHSHTITALIITPETKSGAKEINTKRQSLHLPPFKVILAPLIKSVDGQHVSSTRIRLGQGLPDGHMTSDYFTEPVILTDKEKITLRRTSWGLTFPSVTKLGAHLTKHPASLLITVGDQTTHTLLKSRLHPDICLIDLLLNRQPTNLTKNLSHTITVKNPAGTIQPRLASGIKQIIHHRLVNHILPAKKTIIAKPTIIKILGEEDLAAVPACLLAPLNSLVIYGYKEKLVAVPVTLPLKLKLIKTLSLVAPEM